MLLKSPSRFPLAYSTVHKILIWPLTSPIIWNHPAFCGTKLYYSSCPPPDLYLPAVLKSRSSFSNICLLQIKLFAACHVFQTTSKLKLMIFPLFSHLLLHLAKMYQSFKAQINSLFHCSKKESLGTSLMVPWLRIHLPMQGIQVQPQVWEDSICHRATKAHAPWLLNLHATTTAASVPRACAQQQEKPPRWEACALQLRVAPLNATREIPQAARIQPNQK